MTPRRNALAAIEQEAIESPTGLLFIRIDGALRMFLKPSDVASLCQVSTETVIKWLEDGKIAHARDALQTKFYPIPVTELPKLVALAKAA